MKLQSRAGDGKMVNWMGLWSFSAVEAPTHMDGHEGDNGEDEEEDPQGHVSEEHNLERTKST